MSVTTDRWLITLPPFFASTCTVFLAAFVWPRIYQEKQADIDRVYGIALAHLNQYYDLVISKLPLGKKKKEE
jgi:threonine/homoserine efflux transporter RhtA